MICKINKELLKSKGLLFFELGAVGSLFIYLIPFMNEFGITTTEIAVIGFVAHFISFFSKPIFGHLADKYHKYREIMAIGAVLSILVNFAQLTVPKHSKISSNRYILIDSLPENSNLLTMCYLNLSTVTCWPSLINACNYNSTPIIRNNTGLLTTNIYCLTYPVYIINGSGTFGNSSICSKVSQNCSYPPQQRVTGMTWSLVFWIFLFSRIITFASFSVTMSLTDAVTFVILGKENAHKFGFTRMFGTIGILIFSVLTGLVLQGFHTLHTTGQWKWISYMMSISQFTPCFIIGLSAFFFVMILALLLKKDKPVHTESLWKSMKWLFRNARISIFFIYAILGGFTLSAFMDYYFLILFQKFNNMPKYFPGLASAMMMVSEILFLGVSPRLLKFMNDEFWISFSFCVWSVRWLFYIFIDNFWLLILTELLHGPAFGLMISCMTSHISKFADRTNQGQIQCLYSGLFFNIGNALGSCYGGVIIEKYGYNTLFKSMSAITLLCGICYYPLQKWIVSRYCNNNREKIENQNNGNKESLLDMKNAEAVC